MTQWTLESLRRLDRRFAEEGVHPHQRPLKAALELLRHQTVTDFGDPEVRRIMKAYEAMLPEANATWPGMGTGLVAVVDQVRRVTVPVVFGQVKLKVSRGLGFTSDQEWWAWCREDRELAKQTINAFTDILDLFYGLNAMSDRRDLDLPLWHMTTANLSDCSNTLPTGFALDSVTQSTFMTVELSLKAALVRNGAAPDSFRKGEGHHVVRLAERLAREVPHRDDVRVAAVAASMPLYVKNRYSPRGLTRLQVTTLALGAQFVAASAVRRFSDLDFAAKSDSPDWPPLLGTNSKARGG